ncbi:MAG: phosphate ABC transporter permease subunit PstC, partial [Chloroflexota bacterium]
METLESAGESGRRQAAAAFRQRHLWRKLLSERLIKLLLLLFSTVSIVTTVGIVSILIFETVLFFQEVSIFRFLTETEWTPLFAQK